MPAMQRQLILVVDDDMSLAEMLQLVLRKEGYDTAWCGNGLEVPAAVRRVNPALILLDVMLPGMSGIDVCRLLRKEHVTNVPIVMLTARSDTGDVVSGLEAGADDYIPKPFKARELLARIKTRLRRPTALGSMPKVLRTGDLDIDITAHEVRRGDKVIALTPLEFDLLLELAKNPNRVYTREDLLNKVWGYHHATDTRLVNVHVQRLRSKIELRQDKPQIVLTVRGVGYKAGEPISG